MKEQIHFGPWRSLLAEVIEEEDYSSIFYVVDRKVSDLHQLELGEEKAAFINASEASKNLDTVSTLWNSFSAANCDRKSLIVCIGGGFTTDVGGFAAATYMRGVSSIYIPSTVLGMLDASIGGKTGINFRHFKNRIGSFHPSDHIIVDTRFLESLPELQWWSGYAELIKHALIADRDLWNELLKIEQQEDLRSKLDKLLAKGMSIKQHIVKRDYQEEGVRKKLNFGHTFGHALESLSLEKDTEVLHGFAVAVGIWVEARLSLEIGLLSNKEFDQIADYLHKLYPFQNIEEKDISAIMRYMKGDKKNIHSSINFTLLEGIGNAVTDQSPARGTIEISLRSYIDEYKKL
jgi:3-dehydroquinate synthase